MVVLSLSLVPVLFRNVSPHVRVSFLLPVFSRFPCVSLVSCFTHLCLVSHSMWIYVQSFSSCVLCSVMPCARFYPDCPWIKSWFVLCIWVHLLCYCDILRSLSLMVVQYHTHFWMLLPRSKKEGGTDNVTKEHTAQFNSIHWQQHMMSRTTD